MGSGNQSFIGSEYSVALIKSKDTRGTQGMLTSSLSGTALTLKPLFAAKRTGQSRLELISGGQKIMREGLLPGHAVKLVLIHVVFNLSVNRKSLCNRVCIVEPGVVTKGIIRRLTHYGIAWSNTADLSRHNG